MNSIEVKCYVVYDSILQRIEEGLFMEEKEFDMKLFNTVRRLVKEYDIRFDKESIIFNR